MRRVSEVVSEESVRRVSEVVSEESVRWGQ